jgi:hypothetical protein
MLTLYTAIVPLVFGYYDKIAAMGLSAVIGCLLLAFANIEKFESFRGAGFEAKLKKAVKDAYVTIDKLKNLSTSLAEPIVTSITMENRFMQYIPTASKFEMIHDIERCLKELGVSERKIQGTTKFFYELIEHDHVNRIIHNMNKDTNSPTELDTAIKYILDKVPKGFDIYKFKTKYKIIPEGELAELFTDLDYFRKNHTLRREDKWKS